MVEGTTLGCGGLTGYQRCKRLKVRAALTKGSVSLSQKSAFPSITFNEQESPGDPKTIPDGQLLLMTSDLMVLDWGGMGRSERPCCCGMRRGLAEGKGFVTGTRLGGRPGKVSRLTSSWLQTGGDARGRLFLDVLLITRWSFWKY